MLFLVQIFKESEIKWSLQILYAELSSFMLCITTDVHLVNAKLTSQTTKWHVSWKTFGILRIQNLHYVVQILISQIQKWHRWNHEGTRSDSTHLKATVWTSTSVLTRFYGVNFAFARRLCDANKIVVMALAKPFSTTTWYNNASSNGPCSDCFPCYTVMVANMSRQRYSEQTLRT